MLFLEKVRFIPPGSHWILLASSPGYRKTVVVAHRSGGHHNSLSLIFILQLKSQKNEKIVATVKNLWEWQKNDRNLF